MKFSKNDITVETSLPREAVRLQSEGFVRIDDHAEDPEPEPEPVEDYAPKPRPYNHD